MEWEVEVSDEFIRWWKILTESQQDDIAASIQLIEFCGPNLGFPHSSGIHNSKHSNMRELRVQSKGNPIRLLYAFDPRRIAIVLLGGDKTGDKRWYEKFIPIADRLYDEHLQEIGANNG